MKLLLSGFSSRDEAAFDLFLKRFLPAWRWHGQPAKRDHVLADADLLVIDLAAHGWSQFNEVSLEKLVLATGPTVAILLMPPHDASWQTAPAQPGCTWVWLGKPYNAEAMRDALSRAGELVKTQQKRAISAKPVAQPAPLPKQPQPSVAVSVQTAVLPQGLPAVDVEQGMSADELALRLAQYPVDRYVLLRKLLASLQTQVPFEVRFTVQHFLIVHPLDDWVASNTPMSVVKRVAGSDTLAAAVSVRALAPDLVEDRVHQLGAVPQDLGEFLLQLATSSFPTTRSTPVQ